MQFPELVELWRTRGDTPALVGETCAFTYAQLADEIVRLSVDETARSLPAKSVVLVSCSHSHRAVLRLLALWLARAIVVPYDNRRTDEHVLQREASAEYTLNVQPSGRCEVIRHRAQPDHALITRLQSGTGAGIVLFSSGTTGKPKAALHELARFLDKFRVDGKPLRTLAFLGLDHVAGLDTLFYTLVSGGCLVFPESRSIDGVCAAIARERIEVLSVTPSFLNLLLLTGQTHATNLSTLKYVTYGSERMPPSTLTRCAAAFPHVKLLQRYGLTELGALQSQSPANDSVWIRLDTRKVQLRVVDGVLQIRSSTAMLGYLNAPDPFTQDGWYITEDAVEVQGEYFKFLGRESELINVAGRKVYPGEIENVIQGMPEVAEVIVFGQPHPVLGETVHATIRPNGEQDLDSLPLRVRIHCKQSLAPYKVPMRVTVTREPLTNARFKKKSIV